MTQKFQTILIVEDELDITKALIQHFERNYTVLSATNVVDALHIIKIKDVQVIISDKCMTDIGFLSNIKKTHPDVIKIILTNYTDIKTAIAAINSGQVFRYITKPWNPDEIDSIIREAFKKYELVASNKALIQELNDANNNLEKNVKEKTEELERGYKFREDSQEHFPDVFNNTMLGYQSLDINGHFIDVNQQWLDTLGYERNEVIGKWFGDFLSPMYQDGFRKRFQLFKAQGHIHSEFEMKHKNGSILFIAFDGKIGNDLNGNFKQTHCILQDITEKRKSDVALKESETQYKNLANSGLSLIWTSGTDKLCNYFNEPWLRFTGRTLQQEMGNGWIEGVHPDDFDKCLKTYITAFDKREAFSMEYRLRHVTGEYRWLIDMGTPNYNSLGEFLGYIGHCFDIHDRKIAEKALEESEEKFRNIFEYSSVGKSLTSLDGKLKVNNAFSDIIGYTEEELNHLTYREITYPDDIAENEKVINSILCGEKQSEFWQKRYIHKKGHIVWVDITTTLQRDATGNPQFFITEITDITERKKVEQALQKSKERYSRLLNHLETAIVIHASDTTIITSNPRASILLGLSNDQMKGKAAIDPEWKFVDINNKPLSLENYPVNIIVNSNKSITDQILGIHRSASEDVIWVEVNGFPVLNKKNEITEILISFNDISNRIIAEKKLQNSEEKFKKAFMTIPESVTITTIESGVYKDVNKGFTQITGYEASEVIGLKSNELDIWYDISDRQYIVNELQNADVVENYVCRFRKKSGDIIYGMLSATLIELDGEKYILLITRDVTRLKNVEYALKESNDRLNVILESTPIAIWDWDVNTDKWYATSKYYTMLGYEPENDSPNRQVWLNRLHPDDRQIVNEKISKILSHTDENYSYEARMLHADGTYRWQIVIGQVVERNAENKATRLIGVRIDINEKKRAEIALCESEEKLSALFSSMTEMVVMHELILDNKGEPIDYRITDCNEVFTQITGVKKEDAVGQLATKVYQTEKAPYIDEYSKVCFFKENYEYKTYYPPLGRHFLISAVYLAENQFATVTTDISEIINVQEKLIEKNKELENYIYVASHDLRSPLVNIQGFSQRLSKQSAELRSIIEICEADLNHKAKILGITSELIPKTLDYIQTNVTKMDRLINGLLQISRTGRQSLSIQKINMNKLIQSIIGGYNFEITEINAQYTINELSDCFGDENQLNQLFSNIISNTIKYRDPNKPLKLEISSIIRHNRVIYSIKDSGLGISSKYLDKIWNVFYRVDASSSISGDGLGLSMAKRITENHKGKIWVESEEGKGSVFYIELLTSDFGEYHTNTFGNLKEE
jgi:PAS domain S-box-containing protein